MERCQSSKNGSGLPIRSKSKRRSATSEELRLERAKHRRSTRFTSCLSRTVDAKDLKENRAPSSSKHDLSLSGSILLAKKPTKSLSYMEMKRAHQELLSEVDSLHEKTRQSSNEHCDVVYRLTQEMAEQKEMNEQLRGEIERCRARLKDKNSELDNLQKSLEGIKFENEKLVCILEGARVDAATGFQIEQSTKFVTHQHKTKMELEKQNAELDDFINSLDSTISSLLERDCM